VRRRRSDPCEIAVLVLSLLGIGYFTWLLVAQDDPLEELARARASQAQNPP
jgi:hypothetical protein